MRDRSAVRTAGSKAARHGIGSSNAACLPGRDQIREVVLFRHQVEMDNVLNAGRDVGRNEGQHPLEGGVDRIAVAFGVLIHPVGESLDDGGLLGAAGI